MRFIFLLVVIANLAVLAYGHGFFGTPPSERGRTPKVFQERHQNAVVPGQPQ